MEGVLLRREPDPPRSSLRIFPIRHHSPAAALLLERWIESDPPRSILIEGPSDAMSLVPALLDSTPPVALLAYHPGGKSAIYPFARYSPEWVALRVAARLKIPARFIDLPAGAAIEMDRPESWGPPDLEREICRRLGYATYEDFWEATFESGLDLDAYIRLFLDYAHLMRQEPGRVTELDLAREAHMAAEIEKDPGALVVCGAFHAAAFADKTTMSKNVQYVFSHPKFTIIPFSYPRLSEQSGYGAGNRAPWYYQQIYDAQGDVAKASLSALLDVTARLREKGWNTSIADTIEAWRLAKNLSGMRDKSAPGLQELRDAAVACLLQGSVSPAEEILRDATIGRHVGKVSALVGRNALQDEFYAETESRRLPVLDQPQDVLVHLTNDLEKETSAFLHRLRASKIPYATLLEPGRLREKWRLQWSPATDGALIQRILLGESIRQVCERSIRDALAATTSTATAADLHLQSLAANVSIPEALDRCLELAATDADLYSLAVAAQQLRLEPILRRAVLLAPASVDVADETVDSVCTALKILADLAPMADALRAIADREKAHPKAAGLAVALLHEDIETVLARRLSRGTPPAEAARFLEGLLSIHRHVLLRSRPIVGAIDGFLGALEIDKLIPVLPALRRAFSGMSASELRILIETIAAVRGADPKETMRSLKAADAEVAKIMDQWKDLF